MTAVLELDTQQKFWTIWPQFLNWTLDKSSELCYCSSWTRLKFWTIRPQFWNWTLDRRVLNYATAFLKLDTCQKFWYRNYTTVVLELDRPHWTSSAGLYCLKLVCERDSPKRRRYSSENIGLLKGGIRGRSRKGMNL